MAHSGQRRREHALKSQVMTFPVPFRQARLRWLLSTALIFGPFGIAGAQSPDAKPLTGSRAELLARARAADSLGLTQEAFLLRTRLRDGDFEVGDAIILLIDGPALKGKDSVIVRAGKVIHLNEPMGDVSLVGVLRSELADSLHARIAKYFRNTVIRVTPLLRLSVSGAIRAPGFYQSMPDSPLSDVIMRAGQDQQSDLRNIKIKRGDRVLWSGPDVQSALSEGLTLDRLALDPGDEIVVGQKKSNRWMSVVSIGVPILSSILILLVARRR